jgi:hypothetical protein
LGPVVSGPVRVGVAELLVDRTAVVGEPDGEAGGFGSARPLVQAARNPAMSPIASNRLRTGKSSQDHSVRTRDPRSPVDDRAPG